METEEKAKEFRKDRLNKINNGEVWSPSSDGPCCVLHWLPISEKPLFNTDNLQPGNFSEFVPKEIDRGEMPNLDGVRFHSNRKDEIVSSQKNVIRAFWNAQIFCSGALEMTYALPFFEDESNTRRVSLEDILMKLWRTMDRFKRGMSHFEITVPIIVGVSLLHVLNYRFSSNFNPHAHPDREPIILPEALMKNLENMKEVERLILDTLWRSFGIDRCDYYDKHGERIIPSIW